MEMPLIKMRLPFFFAALGGRPSAYFRGCSSPVGCPWRRCYRCAQYDSRPWLSPQRTFHLEYRSYLVRRNAPFWGLVRYRWIPVGASLIADCGKVFSGQCPAWADCSFLLLAFYHNNWLASFFSWKLLPFLISSRFLDWESDSLLDKIELKSPWSESVDNRCYYFIIII